MSSVALKRVFQSLKDVNSVISAWPWDLKCKQNACVMRGFWKKEAFGRQEGSSGKKLSSSIMGNVGSSGVFFMAWFILGAKNQDISASTASIFFKATCNTWSLKGSFKAWQALHWLNLILVQNWRADFLADQLSFDIQFVGGHNMTHDCLKNQQSGTLKNFTSSSMIGAVYSLFTYLLYFRQLKIQLNERATNHYVYFSSQLCSDISLCSYQAQTSWKIN